MKLGKKSFVSAILVVVFSMFLTVFFSSGSSIKANQEEAEVVSEFDSGLLEPVSSENVSTYGAASSSRLIPATPEQIDAANNKYNLEHGNFNPDLNVAYVSNWEQFARAYMDNTVTKIKLTADIESKDITVDGVATATFGNDAKEQRTGSLEIDGGYVASDGTTKRHKLVLYGSKMLATGTTPTGYTETASDGSAQPRAIFHMHDTSIGHPASREAAYSYGFIGARGYHTPAGGTDTNTPYTKNWYFRLGNVDTNADDDTTAYIGIARIIIGYQSEVSMYGDNYLSVTGEVFYLGSFILEDGGSLRGVSEYSNYSIIWFVVDRGPDSTGASGELTVGENSFIYLKNVRTSAVSYPAFYATYKDAVIKEGATVNIDMQGNAWRFDAKDSSLTVKKDATLNLISRGTGAPFQFGGGGGPFASGSINSASPSGINAVFEPGSNLFVYGKTAIRTGAVNFSTGTSNSSLTLNNVAQYDIRNSTGSGDYRAINLNHDAGTGVNSNSVTIINSDISIWKNNIPSGTDVNITGPPSDSFIKVGLFDIKSQNANTDSEAASRPYPVTLGGNDSEFASTLGKYNPIRYKRISGRNTAPEIIWTPVTDADKTLRVRVYLGEEPTGYDSEGNTILQPVYAQAGEVNVYLTDVYGQNYGPIATDQNGYVSIPVEFQKAGLEVKAYAERGQPGHMWTGETSEFTVIDITPPEPATVVGDKVTNATKQLIGENLEPDAKVFLTISGSTSNAGTLVPAGTVGADGKWTHDLSAYLNAGDTVTIYLQDDAEKISADVAAQLLQPKLPITHTDSGNINPYPNDVTYSDATFKKATSYTVEDIIPDQPSMTKTLKVYRNGTETTTPQVNDTATYTLTAKNNKPITYTTTWVDVVITDTIPEGLDFDAASVKINGNTPPAGAVTYAEDTRLLTVNVGDLDSQVEAVVTFDAKINRDRIGETIRNEAKASGTTPRETNDPFVPGINPDPIYEVKEATAYVDTPGTIAGVLEITSAPAELNFGVEKNNVDTRVNQAIYSEPLTVSDSRAQRDGWTLRAQLEQVLTNVDDSSKTLPQALRYKRGGSEIILNGSPQVIYSDDSGAAGDFVVSDDWSESGDGFKLEVPAGQVRKLGEYQAVILWTLTDAN